MFIAIEGLDYSGKTTVIKMLNDLNDERMVFSREPGASKFGNKIRDIIKSERFNKPEYNSFILHMFFSALLETSLKLPSLEGKIVITDRWFASTYSYQGYGLGLKEEVIKLEQTNLLRNPDLYIYLDVSDKEREKRRKERGLEQDVYDSKPKEFIDKVRQGYKDYLETKNTLFIDANQSSDIILKIILDKIEEMYEGRRNFKASR